MYLTLLARIAFRSGWSDLNSSARGFFVGVLVMTVVLYTVAVVQAVVLRHREGALIPVCLAALFGIFLCLLVFGF